MLRLIVAGVVLLGLAGGSGCQAPPETPTYVARVGDQYFTKQDLKEALEALPAGRDTSQAREQIIEQWVTNTLLYREARRRGLADEPEVQERLEKSRRSVLTSALIDRLYEEASLRPSDAQVRTYFEQYREALRLHRPFVRVRHLSARSAEAARSARSALQEATRQAAADSLWPAIARRYTLDAARARSFSTHYHPEGMLFDERPEVAAALARLQPGEIAPIFEANRHYHVLQLVERLPAGTQPELAWIEGEIRQRLLVRQRKQMYARQVQRLRNEARSRGELDVRLDSLGE